MGDALERMKDGPWCTCRLGLLEAELEAKAKGLDLDKVIARSRTLRDPKPKCIGCSMERTISIHYGEDGIEFLRAHLGGKGGDA